MAEAISLKETRFYMRNVRTRMPFKYGAATLTAVPILHAMSIGELADGTRCRGWAADILPPKWFDKDPAKEYGDNVDDLIWSAQAAAGTYAEAAGSARSVFDIWMDAHQATLALGDDRGLNHLTAGHGSSLIERTLIDAVGVARGRTYHQMLTVGDLGLDVAAVHTELAGIGAAGVGGAEKPLDSIAVRHTVGLADPLRDSDVASEDRLDDGLPQSLEQYVRVQGLVYFKVKVNGDLDGDLQRLVDIATLLDVACGGSEYRISLDGNEQYSDMEGFMELLEGVRQRPELARFYESVIYIEQPLERGVALDAGQEKGIRRVSELKPVVIDESDGDIDSFKISMELGYSGVSSKNCKGLIKAIANQALARTRSTVEQPLFVTAEDLMNLAVVPLHQDLTHVAALGITHVERNGHHYVHGLDHLSAAEQDSCAAQHGSLYRKRGDSLVLDVERGRIDIRSLQIPGLGVGDAAVDESAMVSLDEWDFASLQV